MLTGTPGYDGGSYEGVPFKPCGDEKCIGCGTCVKICPQKAICAENPCQTDEERCIACGALLPDFKKMSLRKVGGIFYAHRNTGKGGRDLWKIRRN
ncbi:MAG: 4Fe-4S binding protein [Eubacterium sp.]|nr:4Fe-4S binding protein [Eubacterium sp.]